MSKIDLSNARIMITNDDGYNSAGIMLLKEISEEFSNDVWIVAPEFEKSGASHALSFQNSLTLKKHDERVFSVNGTPSDCVVIGIQKVLKEKSPDIIFSGINSGCNVGEDVTYSGTIAAAMEGIIRKIPSIAISQNYESGKKNEIVWDSSKKFLKEILSNLTSIGWSDNTFMNINFPHCLSKDVKGLEITSQGNRENDDLVLYEVEKNEFRFGLKRRIENNVSNLSNNSKSSSSSSMTDVQAIANQYISITPLHIDLTHSQSLDYLKTSLNTDIK